MNSRKRFVWMAAYLVIPIIIVMVGIKYLNRTREYSHHLVEINKIQENLLNLQMSINNHYKHKSVGYQQNSEKAFRKIYYLIKQIKKDSSIHPLYIDLFNFENTINEYHNSFCEYISISKEAEDAQVDFEGRYSWVIYYFNLFSIKTDNAIYASFNQANGFAKSSYISIIEGDSSTLTRDFYAMNYNLMFTLNNAKKEGRHEIINSIEKYKTTAENYFNALKQVVKYQNALDLAGNKSKETAKCYFREIDEDINRLIKKSMNRLFVLLTIAIVSGILIFFYHNRIFMHSPVENKMEETKPSVKEVKDNYAFSLMKNEISKIKNDADKLYEITNISQEQYLLITESIESIKNSILDNPAFIKTPVTGFSDTKEYLNSCTKDLKTAQRLLNENALIIMDFYDQIPAPLLQYKEIAAGMEDLSAYIDHSKSTGNYTEFANTAFEQFKKFKKNHNDADHHLNSVLEKMKYIELNMDEITRLNTLKEDNNLSISDSVKNLARMNDEFSCHINNCIDSLTRISNDVTKIYLALKFGESLQSANFIQS